MPACLFGQTLALVWEQVLSHHVVVMMKTEVAEAEEETHVGVWSTRYMTFEAIDHRPNFNVQASEWVTVKLTTVHVLSE